MTRPADTTPAPLTCVTGIDPKVTLAAAFPFLSPPTTPGELGRFGPYPVRRLVGAGAAVGTDALLDAMKASGVPFLPGVSTTSEVVALLERGITEMKFFPAEAAGGTAYLKALSAPLPQARFCPTGGVSLASAPSYLALPNVGCVGGSWMVPGDAVAAKDWDRVARLAAEAAALGA